MDAVLFVRKRRPRAVLFLGFHLYQPVFKSAVPALKYVLQNVVFLVVQCLKFAQLSDGSPAVDDKRGEPAAISVAPRKTLAVSSAARPRSSSSRRLFSTCIDDDSLARYPSPTSSRSSSESSASTQAGARKPRTSQPPTAPSCGLHLRTHPHTHAPRIAAIPSAQPHTPTPRRPSSPPPSYDAAHTQSDSTIRRHRMDKHRRTLDDGILTGVVLPQGAQQQRQRPQRPQSQQAPQRRRGSRARRSSCVRTSSIRQSLPIRGSYRLFLIHARLICTIHPLHLPLLYFPAYSMCILYPTPTYITSCSLLAVSFVSSRVPRSLQARHYVQTPPILSHL
ncbi:hypothetical protein DFH09DRAFT_1302245 [Mycena vulgaris]|nr:hypothetical protein DFH09DRAFT_1302245 [Mycena vulgaris]